MALIVVKAPHGNLAAMILKIRGGGATALVSGMNVAIAPHKPNIVSPYITVETRDREPESGRYLVTLYYDPYNRIPLADGAFIHLAKTYFDPPDAIAELSADCFQSRLRLAEHAHKTDRVIIGPTPPGSKCSRCDDIVTNWLYVVNGPRGEDGVPRYRNLYCQACISESTSVDEVYCPRAESTPASPVARFLLAQMDIHFGADVIVYRAAMQLVYLFGREFYVSELPVAADLLGKHFAGRRRLRITKKVAADMFATTEGKAGDRDRAMAELMAP
jgi:hypothetical protein